MRRSRTTSKDRTSRSARVHFPQQRRHHDPRAELAPHGEGAPRGRADRARHGRTFRPLRAPRRTAGRSRVRRLRRDHRGHGLSMGPVPGDLGPDGWNLLVADEVALTGILRDRHPGLPVTLIGHSLGSFAVQQYLLDHSGLVDEVVLSGTTAVDGLFGEIAAAGGDLIGFFNAEFQPTRTDADWISRDEAQVDAYNADPWCGFAIDEANMGLLAANAGTRLSDPSSVRADLPIYVMVGDKDPLNSKLRLSDLLVQRYRDAGLADLTYQVYADARHEVLNETNRDEVEADLLAWLTRARD
ncbi:alpha/beta fold hydrolase [Nocardia fluminea]|uniref:alpha/beta fold hydrolase n=1 Tax=Nocardia fluminea TaxID=134984 RepID=UPI0033E8A87E